MTARPHIVSHSHAVSASYSRISASSYNLQVPPHTLCASPALLLPPVAVDDSAAPLDPVSNSLSSYSSSPPTISFASSTSISTPLHGIVELPFACVHANPILTKSATADDGAEAATAEPPCLLFAKGLAKELANFCPATARSRTE
jgi:hypothetical protein